MEETKMSFEDYINQKDLKQNTQKAIIREYNKYLEFFDDIQLFNTKLIKNNINDDDFYKTMSSKKQAVGMLINYFSYLNMDKNIDAMRDLLTSINIKMNKDYKIRNTDLKKTLPPKRELLKYNLKNFKEQNYKSYMINYLLYTYNVRNLDLDIIIIKNKNLIKPNKNYLVVKNKYTEYIRDNYKTISKYGKKTHMIKSAKFNYAIREFIKNIYDHDNNEIVDDENNKNNENNDKVEVNISLLNNKKNLTQEIIKYTYKQLSEGDIFKIFITEKKELKHYNKLANNRGTSLDVIMKNYILNN